MLIDINFINMLILPCMSWSECMLNKLVNIDNRDN